MSQHNTIHQNIPSLELPGRTTPRFEASTWLKNNPNSRPFAGNRFTDRQAALAFVDSLYQAGATEVFISDILDEEWRIKEYGGPYADTLIVSLPDTAHQRSVLFQIYSRETEDEGFTPEEDSGQSYLLFWWD